MRTYDKRKYGNFPIRNAVMVVSVFAILSTSTVDKNTISQPAHKTVTQI